MNENPPKRLLYIDLMRTIIIFMLVVMHSFTMYSGTNPSWNLPDGINPIESYSWIQKYTYAFLLESFTFISGFVFSFGISKHLDIPGFFSIFINKLKRLIVPSVVFSVLFGLLFDINLFLRARAIYDIFIGVGHMWYLPMLFLCFILTYGINKVKMSNGLAYCLLVIMSLLSFRIPNYLRISQALYYESFFFLGYIFYHKKYVVKTNYISVLMLVVIVPILLFLVEIMSIQNVFLYKVVSNLIKILYGTIGTVALFSLCHNSYALINSNVMHWIVKLSTLSMGIYLFQEFIIRIIYYKTQFSLFCGSICLPWITIFVVMVISVMLTLLLRKNRIGRLIIG